MTSTNCESCKRPKAAESMYWYAMGRLHDRIYGPDHGVKALEEADLKGVLNLSYCWAGVTAIYDGPNETEFVFASRDCADKSMCRLLTETIQLRLRQLVGRPLTQDLLEHIKAIIGKVTDDFVAAHPALLGPIDLEAEYQKGLTYIKARDET